MQHCAFSRSEERSLEQRLINIIDRQLFLILCVDHLPLLLSDAQPSRVARSIALSPRQRGEERSSEQRLINIVNQLPLLSQQS